MPKGVFPVVLVQVTIRSRSDTLPLLTELRSEALKDRHWRPLLRRLGVRVAFVELNLGLLWASDLSGHRKLISETVQAAQGEMALEEFLRQVRLIVVASSWLSPSDDWMCLDMSSSCLGCLACKREGCDGHVTSYHGLAYLSFLTLTIALAMAMAHQTSSLYRTISKYSLVVVPFPRPAIAFHLARLSLLGLAV